MMVPAKLCFQEMSRKMIRINEGRLCMNRPKIVPQKPNRISKMSKEKIARKRANKMIKILGDQNKSFLFMTRGKAKRV
jgi:hypothetical protein